MCDRLADEKGIYEDLRLAFSKKGVPAMIDCPTTACLPVKGCGMLSGSGTYQVEGDPDGKTKILMSQATMATSFGTATLQMAFDFDLVPSMGTCTSD